MMSLSDKRPMPWKPATKHA